MPAELSRRRGGSNDTDPSASTSAGIARRAADAATSCSVARASEATRHVRRRGDHLGDVDAPHDPEPRHNSPHQRGEPGRGGAQRREAAVGPGTTNALSRHEHGTHRARPRHHHEDRADHVAPPVPPCRDRLPPPNGRVERRRDRRDATQHRRRREHERHRQRRCDRRVPARKAVLSQHARRRRQWWARGARASTPRW